ncbi:hypothetical protein Tco_0981306 [Tanacetum coccineum]
MRVVSRLDSDVRVSVVVDCMSHKRGFLLLSKYFLFVIRAFWSVDVLSLVSHAVYLLYLVELHDVAMEQSCMDVDYGPFLDLCRNIARLKYAACHVLHLVSIEYSRVVSFSGNGWLSFSRRGPTLCYFSKKFDSLKSLNDHFFLIDASICPIFASWYNNALVRRDPLPSDNLVDLKLLEKLDNNRLRLEKKDTICSSSGTYKYILALEEQLQEERNEAQLALKRLALQSDHRSKSLLPHVEAKNIDVGFTNRVGASSIPGDNVGTSTFMSDEGSHVDEFFESQTIDSATAQDIYFPKWNVTNHASVHNPALCSNLIDHITPRGYWAALRNQTNVRFNGFILILAQHVCMVSELVYGIKHEIMSRGKAKLEELGRSCRGEITGEAKMKEEFMSLQDEAAWHFEEQSAKLDTCIDYVICLAINKGIQQGLEAGIEHGKVGWSLAQVEAYDPEVKNKYVVVVWEFENVSFSLLEELEALKDSQLALIMYVLNSEGNAESTPKIRKLQPFLDQTHLMTVTDDVVHVTQLHDDLFDTTIMDKLADP